MNGNSLGFCPQVKNLALEWNSMDITWTVVQRIKLRNVRFAETVPLTKLFVRVAKSLNRWLTIHWKASFPIMHYAACIINFT